MAAVVAPKLASAVSMSGSDAGSLHDGETWSGSEEEGEEVEEEMGEKSMDDNEMEEDDDEEEEGGRQVPAAALHLAVAEAALPFATTSGFVQYNTGSKKATVNGDLLTSQAPLLGAVLRALRGKRLVESTAKKAIAEVLKQRGFNLDPDDADEAANIQGDRLRSMLSHYKRAKGAKQQPPWVESIDKEVGGKLDVCKKPAADNDTPAQARRVQEASSPLLAFAHTSEPSTARRSCSRSRSPEVRRRLVKKTAAPSAPSPPSGHDAAEHAGELPGDFDLTMPLLGPFDCCSGPSTFPTSSSSAPNTMASSSRVAPAAVAAAPAAVPTVRSGWETGVGAWLRVAGQRARNYTKDVFVEDGIVKGRWGADVHVVEGMRPEDVPLALKSITKRKTEFFNKQTCNGETVVVSVKNEKVTGRNETGRKIVIMADGRQILQTGVARWELFDVVVSRTVGLAERYVAGTVSAASLKDEMTKVMVT